jgi:hypothetical protein
VHGGDWPAPGESARIGRKIMTGLIAPTHRSIRKSYENVAALGDQGVLHEMSVRSPFESLLQETARLKDWTFIAERSGKSGGAIIRPGGTLRDRSSLPRGYWEAKDTQDDLETEIKRKIARPASAAVGTPTRRGLRPSAANERTTIPSLRRVFVAHHSPEGLGEGSEPDLI